MASLFLINICGEKGGVQGILWPEQMHEASLGVVVWEEREFTAHLSSNLGKQLDLIQSTVKQLGDEERVVLSLCR